MASYKVFGFVTVQQLSFFFTGLGGLVTMLAGYHDFNDLLQVPVVVGFVGGLFGLIGATLSPTSATATSKHKKVS